MKRFSHLTIMMLFIALNSFANDTTDIHKFLLEKQIEQRQLLEKLVNINSGSGNIKGIHKVGDYLAQNFRRIGFETHWTSDFPQQNRAGTLVISKQGLKKPSLLLIGHLDTVFDKTHPFQHYKQQGEFATGPGTVDMKGGDVIILYALKALAHINQLKSRSITIVLTGDEESGASPSTLSRKPLIAAAKSADIALDFESSHSLNKLAIARRGIVGWVLKSASTGGHSSLIFKDSIGFGAGFEMVRILDKMRTVLREDNLTFNPGLLAAGNQLDLLQKAGKVTASGKINIISTVATAMGDLRFIDEQQRQRAVKAMRKIVQAHLPRTNSNLTFRNGMPAMPPIKENRRLLKIYSRVSQELGMGSVSAMPINERGAGDISYVANYVSGGLVGLGAIGMGEHSDKETIDLSSLISQSERAAAFILMLTT